MKKITPPDLARAEKLTPAEMNKIHFAGNRTPLTPEQLAALAAHREMSTEDKSEKN